MERISLLLLIKKKLIIHTRDVAKSKLARKKKDMRCIENLKPLAWSRTKKNKVHVFSMILILHLVVAKVILIFRK